MRDEVARLLQFVHTLLQPVLRGHNVFEELPLVDYNLRQVAELYETEQIRFLPL